MKIGYRALQAAVAVFALSTSATLNKEASAVSRGDINFAGDNPNGREGGR